MDASDLIKALQKHLARRGPSTYGKRSFARAYLMTPVRQKRAFVDFGPNPLPRRGSSLAEIEGSLSLSRMRSRKKIAINPAH